MFTLKIKTQNAAFEYKEVEVARILRELAEKLERGYEHGEVRDVNGNYVGTFRLSNR